MTIASLTVFIIPAIIIAVCYIAIVCTIWNKGKETALMPAANGNNNGNATVTTSGGQVIEVKRKSVDFTISLIDYCQKAILEF